MSARSARSAVASSLFIVAIAVVLVVGTRRRAESAAPPPPSTVVTSALDDSSAGTLRVIVAGAPSGSTITFSPALANQTITLTQTDASTTSGPYAAPFGSTAIVLDGTTLTIDGSAAPGLVISGNGAQRIFGVTGGASALGAGNGASAIVGSLRLVNLRLSSGIATGQDGGTNAGTNDGGGGGGAAGMGGAVFVDAGSTLVLEGVLVTQCTAQGGNGGVGQPNGNYGAGAGGGGLLTTTNDDSNFHTSGHGGDPNGGAAGVFLTTGGGLGGAGGGGGGGASDDQSTGFPGGPGAAPGDGLNAGAGGFGGGGGGAGVFSLGGVGGFGGGGGGSGGAGYGSIAGGPLGGRGGQTAYGGGSDGGGGGAGLGGAIFVNGGTLQVANSTITQCSALGGSGALAGTPANTVAASQNGSGEGGAIFQRNGTVSVVFSTLDSNTASTNGGALATCSDKSNGGNGTSPGSGSANVTVLSSILSGSTNGVSAVNDYASSTNAGGASPMVTSSANLVVSQTGAPALVAASTSSPQLAALASHGGPTQTLALKTGSPAENLGDPATAAAALPGGAGGVDQRGFARRTGTADAGAFELQPNAISIVSGDGQTAHGGQAFANPIVLQVTDEFGNALEGTTITLTPPASGASASFLPAPAVTDATGSVSLTATANTTQGGPYSTTASVSTPTGVQSASITLTNSAPVPVITITGATPVTAQAGFGGRAFTGNVTVTDVTGLGASTLTVTLGAGGLAADGLVVTPQFFGNVTQAASITGGGGGHPLVVVFGPGATGTDVAATLAAVVLVPAPFHSAGTVVVSAIVTDAAGNSSAPVTTTVTLTSGAPGIGAPNGPSQSGGLVSSGSHSNGCAFDASGAGDPASLAVLAAVALGLVVRRRRAGVRR